MTEEKFEKLVEETLDSIRETIIVKGREYRRNNDPFHNFKIGSQRSGLSPEKVLDGFLMKHEISIADITNDLDKGILPTEAVVNEKFNDNIIYLLLKKAMLIHRIEKANSKVTDWIKEEI